MKLIIDTSSKKMKVILQLNNGEMVENKIIEERHLANLLPQIDYILNSKEVKLVDIKNMAVVLGPGSFTGVRIGVSTVKAFCEVFNDIKIIGIDILKLICYKLKKEKKENFIILIKSTSTKYYCGIYNKDCFLEETKTNEEIKNILKTFNGEVFSLNEEYVFNDFKTKSIFLDANNYIDYVDNEMKSRNFTDKKNLKPIYLSLSQAEEELLKKDKEKKKYND